MKTKFLLSLMIAAFMTFFTAANTYARPIVAMEAHKTTGLECEDCHKNKNVADSCIDCHENAEGTYRGAIDKDGNSIPKEYHEAGKTRLAAIHDSHGGNIRCTVCHTSHEEPKQLYCNNCHQFDVKVK